MIIFPKPGLDLRVLFSPKIPPTDEYDHAVVWLKLHPELIMKAWQEGIRTGEYVSKNLKGSNVLFKAVGDSYFCLTQVKNSGLDIGCSSIFKPLIKKVRADDRIPAIPDDITVDMLPIFAEYQWENDRLMKEAWL